MGFFDKFFKGDKARKQRAYQGAAYNRKLADWVSSGASADTEIKGSLRKLRERSRQLVRDNDYARNTIRAFTTNVIGAGVGFQSQVRMARGNKLDQVTNDKIETAWAKWCQKENCHAAGLLNFSSIERLAVASVAESGEVFIRKIMQTFGGSKVPMALEIIEADYLDENYNAVCDNGNTIKMGIERNQWNRPVAYHFYVAHPGDDGFRNLQTQGFQKVRVPAEEVIHLYLCDRPSQTRGIPWLASSMTRLHQMGGFEESEVVAARAGSAMMFFIQSDEGQLIGDEVQQHEQVFDMESGGIRYLNKGETIVSPQLNRPNGAFEPFIRAMLRGVSAGNGVSYETISRDYSQSNYSSTRQALLEDRDHFRVLQAWVISNFHQAVYSAWLDLAVLSGEVPLSGYEMRPDFFKQPRWMPRGWTWIDPAKEVAAYKEAVRSGFKTLGDVLAETGGDLEDTLTQRARELEMTKDLDLVLDTDPAQVDEKGMALLADPTKPTPAPAKSGKVNPSPKAEKSDA